MHYRSFFFLVFAVLVFLPFQSVWASGSTTVTRGDPMPAITWSVANAPGCTTSIVGYPNNSPTETIYTQWIQFAPIEGAGVFSFAPGTRVFAPAGSYDFSCTADPITATTTLIVQDCPSPKVWNGTTYACVAPAPIPAALHICPANPTISAATSLQLGAWYTAAGTNFTNCITPNGINRAGSATWSSSAPATASVNATGLVTGARAGSTTIGASYSGANGSTLLTVTCAQNVFCTQAQTDTVCQGEDYTFTDNCGTSQSCPGTRVCEYNWKEVAP